MKLTEKQKNCEYCHPYSGIPGDDAQEFDDHSIQRYASLC